MNKLILSFLLLIGLFNNKLMAQDLSLQGHRGARGLYPENTTYGLLKTLQFKTVNTLEFDLSITKDHKVILSHEPWMNEDICKPISNDIEDDKSYPKSIYQMTYNTVLEFDCGSKGNKAYPNQEKIFAHKPLLSNTLKEVIEYCRENKLELPHLNIELKSRESWYKIYCPSPEVFTQLVQKVIIESAYPQNKIIFQSFDTEILKELKQSELNWTLSYLVDSKIKPNKAIRKLGFKPSIISPNFKFINKDWVEKYHKNDILVIPWTVNRIKDMNTLLDYKVDGLISDYPNLYSELNK